MKCENYLCICWKGNKCILEETTLDIHVLCKECIYIDFEKTILETKRFDILKKY